jgi:hypothetical protein
MESRNDLQGRLNSYNWIKLISDINKPLDKEKIIFHGITRFVNSFSPTEVVGKSLFKKIKEEKARTREDAIEFMVKSGLMKNNNEAEGFIDTFKNTVVNFYNGNYSFWFVEQTIPATGEKRYIARYYSENHD